MLSEQIMNLIFYLILQGLIEFSKETDPHPAAPVMDSQEKQP